MDTSYVLVQKRYKSPAAGKGVKIVVGEMRYAGLFCHKCSQSLCIGGIDCIHPDLVEKKPDVIFFRWYGGCVGCGQGYFPLDPHSPVQPIWSFVWKMDPKRIETSDVKKNYVVQSKDGANYSVENFLKFVKKCRIYFMDFDTKATNDIL